MSGEQSTDQATADLRKPCGTRSLPGKMPLAVLETATEIGSCTTVTMDTTLARTIPGAESRADGRAVTILSRPGYYYCCQSENTGPRVRFHG